MVPSILLLNSQVKPPLYAVLECHLAFQCFHRRKKAQCHSSHYLGVSLLLLFVVIFANGSQYLLTMSSRTLPLV